MGELEVGGLLACRVEEGEEEWAMPSLVCCYDVGPSGLCVLQSVAVYRAPHAQ